VEVGDTVEETVLREVKEETNIDLSGSSHPLEQFHVYSDPRRDKRRHTVSAVVRCIITVQDIMNVKKGDDAKQVVVVTLKEAVKLRLAFDHEKILRDFIKRYHPSLLL
jgi:8-oxo-dGTP diphosphatase